MSLRYASRRAVVLLSLVCAASGVRASDVKVAEVAPDGARFSGVDYGISAQFQRAWLVLHYTEKGPCGTSEGECDVDRPIRVRVPGLTYDPASRQVSFREGGGEPVTCANVVRHRFLVRWESADQTGECVSRAVPVESRVDDGYGGTRERREVIYFGVRR